MANLAQRFLDHFDNATVDLDASAGNGSITEPAGTTLQVGCSAGQNCNGWDGTTAPFATKLLDAITIPDMNLGLLIAEARITGFTYSGTTCIQYLVWDVDRTHGYWFGWYPGDSKVYVQGRRGGTGETFYTSGSTYTGPSTTAHRYRIIWNPTHRPITMPGVAYRPLNPAEMAFVFSTDDGASWVVAHLRDPSEQAGNYRIGLMARNWSPFPSMQQSADYLRLLQTDSDGTMLHPTEMNPESEMDFGQDGYDFSKSAGPTSHLLSAVKPGLDAGNVVVPGPTNAQPDAHKPDATTAQRPVMDFGQDGHSMGGIAGGPQRWFWPRELVGAGYVPGDVPIGRPTGEGIWMGEQSDRLLRPRAEVGIADKATKAILGGEPNYHTGTIDSGGRPHFWQWRPVHLYHYDTTGEKWTDPVTNLFTGYARDGKYYVNGVDQGTQAPWAGEAASDNRGARDDFPERALICVAEREVIIFDVTAPPAVTMWMRFRIGNDASNFWMLGRGTYSITKAVMRNGVLCVVTQQNSWESGRLFLIDFKATGQTVGNLIGQDNHYKIVAGKNITHRHENNLWTTTGVSPSLRLQSEYLKHVDAYLEEPNLWVCVGGEDYYEPIVLRVDQASAVPQQVIQTYGSDMGEANLDYYRPCIFDEQGWLWFAIDKRVWRNAGDYKQGVIYTDLAYSKSRSVALPSTVRSLASDGNWLWAATDRGVYRIHKGTLVAELTYTIAGGGGGGRLNNPPDGELLVGTRAEVAGIAIARLAESSYLAVATKAPDGGVTLIRLYDDIVIDSKVTPELDEDGAYFHGLVFG